MSCEVRRLTQLISADCIWLSGKHGAGVPGYGMPEVTGCRGAGGLWKTRGTGVATSLENAGCGKHGVSGSLENAGYRTFSITIKL